MGLVQKQTEPDTKLRLYQICILPILLYGSEMSWTLLADDRRWLRSFHMNCQRQLYILGIKWHFRIRNMNIADTSTGLPSIQEIISNRRLALFRHVVQLDARIPAHQALNLSAATRSGHRPDACWSRAAGRPHYTHGFRKLAMEHH